ncbi:hypothetical protein K466DRAFT_667169 [Polyporus arcularius HHB13444]|uniref:Uncharacterized protein n=1 Tax=Polyporus arcularius HHB13444 TaxID=1314778 RepID=A0A5C3P6D0_9APHY|nr:hypothetical protein K466DRAFT_667169 [Polyporus arcularius HHB13444]
MYELKLVHLDGSTLAFLEPPTVLLAAVLILSVMIYYAFPAIFNACHSFKSYRRSDANNEARPHSLRSPIPHHPHEPEKDSTPSVPHEHRVEEVALMTPSEHKCGTSLEVRNLRCGDLPSTSDCIITRECHDTQSAETIHEAEAPPSVEPATPERESDGPGARLPNISPTPAYSSDLSAAPHGLASEATSSGPDTANLTPDNDIPPSVPDAAETISEQLESLPGSSESPERDTSEYAGPLDPLHDDHTSPGAGISSIAETPFEPLALSAALTHPQAESDENTQAGLEPSRPLEASPVCDDEASAGPMIPQDEPEAGEAELEDDLDNHAYIMQSALLVDVHGDGKQGASTAHDPHPSSGVDQSQQDDHGEEDRDTEWTSVDHAEGQTPRATTPVDRVVSPTLNGDRPVPGVSQKELAQAPSLTWTLEHSTVLLTKSEYLQLGDVSAADSQLEDESEAEDRDFDSAPEPSLAPGSASRGRKHTPSHLDLKSHTQRRDAPASPGSVGSPASPATPGGTRVHTPDRPDWAIASRGRGDEDAAKNSRARQHSYEHPDWAVAPHPDADSDSECAIGQLHSKGRPSSSAGGTRADRFRDIWMDYGQ